MRSAGQPEPDPPPQTIESVTFCGRRFGGDELVLMRQVAREGWGLGVTEIARTLCELLDWKRPNGQLKNHECRQLLEQLAGEGFLRLPPLRPWAGLQHLRLRRAEGSSPPAPLGRPESASAQRL